MEVTVSLMNQENLITNFTTLLQQNTQTLLYFYPKDNTPGCTLEAKDFSDAYPFLIKAGIGVYGVSKDSVNSHCNFISKYGLSIPLISDPELLLHQTYGSWGDKMNFGKKYQGTIRSTYLLDQKGNILHAWENVRAKGHVGTILKELGVIIK